MSVGSFFYNLFRNEATPDQVKEFFNRFENMFELLNHLMNEFKILREDLPISTAKSILNKTNTIKGFEDLITEFICFKGCADSITEYNVSINGKHEKHIVIADRGKVYRLTGLMLSMFDNSNSYYQAIHKQGYVVNSLNPIWTKSKICRCCGV